MNEYDAAVQEHNRLVANDEPANPFKHLGEGNSYAVFTDKFNPDLLEPISRKDGRALHGIYDSSMVGVDVLTCHEATFLTDSGCPIAGTVKFVYDASTPFMVESKSAKLYFNSFDMCRMGPDVGTAAMAYEKQLSKDLSACVGGRVRVAFYASTEFNAWPKTNLLTGYRDILSEVPDVDKIHFDDFSGQKSHITLNPSGGVVQFFTNALRSRCRHTKQKDTGLAAIYHHSNHGTIDPLSAFKQIVSLREVNEFHEFCAEKLFVEMTKATDMNDDIMVMLLYSRRGSLDINPVRATSYELIPDALQNVSELTLKVQGQ